MAVIVVSLAAPMNRAMIYFKVASVLYGVLILSSLFGVAYLVISEGFFPVYRKLEPPGPAGKWVP
jgi:hypothetical protein